MNAMENTENYWDIPRFVLGLQISSDAKVLYGLMINMNKEKAFNLVGLSKQRLKKVIKELETENLIVNGKVQNEKEYISNKKIIKVNFNQNN